MVRVRGWLSFLLAGLLALALITTPVHAGTFNFSFLSASGSSTCCGGQPMGYVPVQTSAMPVATVAPAPVTLATMAATSPCQPAPQVAVYQPPVTLQASYPLATASPCGCCGGQATMLMAPAVPPTVAAPMPVYLPPAMASYGCCGGSAGSYYADPNALQLRATMQALAPGGPGEGGASNAELTKHMSDLARIVKQLAGKVDEHEAALREVGSRMGPAK